MAKGKTDKMDKVPQSDKISGRSLIPEGNLDQVRDILFGAQLKELDKKSSDLERLIKTELEHTQNEFRSRLGILEDFIKSEVSSLTSKIKKEASERNADVERLTDRQDDHKRQTQTRLSELEELLDNTGREIRKMILEQARNLTDAAEKNYETLKATLAEKANGLHENKTDRAALAQMFSDMAIRLSNDQNDSGEAESES